ncbi:efflux transporter outer membrane subunit [Flavobacterium cellulosilyticum]|uniref:Efflux transporter outer membrane subunit n=1 Tax=Flavobacterium cellulosilyticum TaxID=2541731 RepID=A0A4V2YYY3_9FLAO|nr:efflux transporter outer membrane subunit [Flavobacterium cellulosilyticum]TDD94937.1 efflux transporter outer membrane subunit [Flavobacterium cellulosilyticum]
MKNKIYRLALLGVTATVMQSCFVAKEYQRPKLQTENLYRTEVVSTDSTSLADVAWDKIFTDPLLQGYISKGLKNNLDIRIAMQNIAAAQATMKQGEMGYFPTLSASTDWTQQKISKNSQSGSFLNDLNTHQYQLYGNLSWEADIWGKIRSNKRATNAAYLQTTAVNQAIKTQLIANIATTYYQLLAVDAQIKIAEETLINRNKSVETILALKKAGNVTEVGVKQTEAQKYATEIIIADLKNNIIILENTMSVLLGEASGKIERSNFESQNLQPIITLGVPTNLLRNRPDVIAAEYNLISNFELTNVAKSGFYPSLKITAAGGLQSIDLKNWFSANSIFANIVTGLTQPILNQRQVRTKFEIAKANQEKAYLQFEQSLLIAGKEVSDALAQYNNETYKITVREKQADALTKAATFSDELLTYGLANYLEVLTSKNDALNTRLNLADNKFQQYKAIIQLYRALGGGWK